jgi:hypothetical protein
MSSPSVPSIPPISEIEVLRRALCIVPLIRRGQDLFFIKPVPLFTVAFTWNPTTTAKAEGLCAYKTVNTWHTCGIYEMFQPSWGEVLAQLDENDLKRAFAFEIISPPVPTEALVTVNGRGFHPAKVVLYERRLKDAFSEPSRGLLTRSKAAFRRLLANVF